MIRKTFYRLFFGTGIALTVLTGPAALAEDAFKPYSAVFDLKRSVIRAELAVSLEYDAGSGTYVYRSQGETKGLAAIVDRKPTDETRFSITDGAVRPLASTVDEGGKDDEGDYSLEFDWEQGQATVTNAAGETTHAIEPGYQSPGSSDFSTRLDLMQGKALDPLTIVDDEGADTYIQEITGEEKLSTAIGELDTIRYRSYKEGSRREVESWVAPELGYLPVQVIQKKDGKSHYVMKILSYEAN